MALNMAISRYAMGLGTPSRTLGLLNDNQFMCVERSVKFDLAEVHGIINGARTIIGLFNYLDKRGGRFAGRRMGP
jgi:hypothetical protein